MPALLAKPKTNSLTREEMIQCFGQPEFTTKAQMIDAIADHVSQAVEQWDGCYVLKTKLIQVDAGFCPNPPKRGVVTIRKGGATINVACTLNVMVSEFPKYAYHIAIMSQE